MFRCRAFVAFLRAAFGSCLSALMLFRLSMVIHYQRRHFGQAAAALSELPSGLAS